MVVCPLCRGSGYYATRSAAIRCPLCRGNRQVDDALARKHSRHPLQVRRRIRRGIQEETRLAGLERGDEHLVASAQSSRVVLGAVVIAWIAYEIWTVIRFATTASARRPPDFIGTWVVVSAVFASAAAVALRVPADVFSRFRRSRR